MTSILLKTLRLKGGNSAMLAGPGSTTIDEKSCDMLYFPREEFVAARKRNGEVYLIPTSDIAYMVPAEDVGLFEELDAKRKEAEEERMTAPSTPDADRVQPMTGALPPAPEQPSDTVRFVKINGRVVERKGAPQTDELVAIAEAKAGVERVTPAEAREIFEKAKAK